MSFNKMTAVLPSDKTITSLQGKVYPTLAGGVTVTSSATAWTLGNAAEIVAADVITKEFDIQEIVIENLSAVAVYELVIYEDGTEKGRVRLNSLSALSSHVVSSKAFSATPFAANSVVTAKLATDNAAGDTATISLQYQELN